MTWCFGLGRVAAAKADMEGFMQKPTVENEAKMLHFKPAVLGRLAGVLVQGPISKPLVFGGSVRHALHCFSSRMPCCAEEPRCL